MSVFGVQKRQRERVMSVDKKKLTLSGNKILVSSLSNSLIKFYQAEQQNQKQMQISRNCRNAKVRSYSASNCSNSIEQIAKKINKHKLKDYRSIDEYGILVQNSMKANNNKKKEERKLVVKNPLKQKQKQKICKQNNYDIIMNGSKNSQPGSFELTFGNHPYFNRI